MDVVREIIAIQVPVNYVSQLTRKNEVLQLIRYKKMAAADQLYAIEQAEILFSYAFGDDKQKQMDLLDQYAAVLSDGDIKYANDVRNGLNSSNAELLKTYLPGRNQRIQAAENQNNAARIGNMPGQPNIAGRMMNGYNHKGQNKTGGPMKACNKTAAANEQNKTGAPMNPLQNNKAIKYAGRQVANKQWTMKQAEDYVMENLTDEEKKMLKQQQQQMKSNGTKWHGQQQASTAARVSGQMTLDQRTDYADAQIKNGSWTPEQARDFVAGNCDDMNNNSNNSNLSQVESVLSDHQQSTAGILDSIKGLYGMSDAQRAQSLNDAMNKLNINSKQLQMASDLVKKQLKQRGLPSNIDEATKFAASKAPFPYSVAINKQNLARLQNVYKTLAADQGHNNAIAKVGAMFAGVDMNEQQSKWYTDVCVKIDNQLDGDQSKRFQALAEFINDKLKAHKMNELSVSEQYAVLTAKSSMIDTIDPKLIGKEDYAMFLDILA